MLISFRNRRCAFYMMYLLPALITVGTSCVTPKQLTYFQKDVPAFTPTVNPFLIYPGYGDILYVQVNSLDTAQPPNGILFYPFQRICRRHHRQVLLAIS